MSDHRFVHALALGLDPGWRRLPLEGREKGALEFTAAFANAGEVTCHGYSMIGLKAGVDILLWSLAPSFEALENRAAALLRTGLGGWMSVRHSFVGIIQPSQYVKRPNAQEQSLFSGERSRYLVVYPFTKATDWYLLGRDARQGIMNEHIRIGHQFPEVRQLLANSFGVDDMDFLVAYETDDLVRFSDLVRALRASDSRRSTLSDTPILTGVHRPMPEIVRMLGA